MRRLVLAAALVLLAHAAHAAGPAKRFVVFFGSWSALIDEPAKASIAAAAAEVRAEAGRRLIVTGYASTVGGGAANGLLAQLRAQVVSDELVAEGVAADRIAIAAVGPTSYVLDPLESRRVVIDLADR